MKSTLSFTQNGAVSNPTTGSKVLDLFGSIAALRNASKEDIIKRFEAAFSEDKELALKCLFYARDIRGGQGERRVFRVLVSYLATQHPNYLKHLIKYIPDYGRWDDMFELFYTDLESTAFNIILDQLIKDVRNCGDKATEPVSLLGKWMPSENASSKNTKSLAKHLIKKLGRSSKDYRLMLTSLRKEINVLENLLCSNKWDQVDYSKIPGRAGLLYREAFLRHDEARYRDYLGKVVKGEAKIKTKVLYPYDVVAPIFSGTMHHIGDKYFASTRAVDTKSREALDVYWNNLPNYFGKEPRNTIAVVDTSGSMRGFPIQVAASLGIYLAERNNGLFKNHFISFSQKPQLQEVKGSDIFEKVVNLTKTDWGQNTNLQAVFELILNLAVKNKLVQEDLPNQIFIISDFEFDRASDGKTNFEAIQDKFSKAGYQMPELVFWNVNATSSQTPITKRDKFVKLVSGCNPSILTKILGNKHKDAYELMLETLNSPRYEPIVSK
jgi:uncharacterized protein DUF2828